MRNRVVVAILIGVLLAGALWMGRRVLTSGPVSPPSALTPAPAHIPEAPAAAAAPVVPVAPAQSPPVVKPLTKPTAPPIKKTVPARQVSKPTVPVPVPIPHPYTPPAPPPPPPQEWKGNSDTSITRAGQIVVQNDTQWTRFWTEHHPHEVSPDVDFSKSMVVGIFLGQRPADGFSVEITGTRATADALIVDYIERAPPPGTFQMAVEAYPFDIKVIPRSTLHVKFNKLSAEYRPDASLPKNRQ